MKPFRNRTEAGRHLAGALKSYAHRPDVVVLALPRGGVPVAYEIARELAAPLDVFIVRKLGFPGHEEFAIGAIATGGVRVMNETALGIGRVTPAQIDAVAERELRELHRRERMYRGDQPPPDMSGRIGILVDDGLATGSTMRAAVAALRQLGPSRIVVAVPIASREACDTLRQEADEILCLATPERFQAVGQWYLDFTQTTDDEVQDLLERNRRESADTAHRS